MSQFVHVSYTSSDACVECRVVIAYILFQDMGTIVLGKIELGTIAKGQILTIMPNKVSPTYVWYSLLL